MGKANAKAPTPVPLVPTKKKVSIKTSARRAEKESAIVALKKDEKYCVGSRKLDRRNTDQVSARSIRLGLGMYPRSQIDGNVDDDGKTID